ncbi:MAG TPA: hypothetical protein PKA82_04420 [Pyrinomonadaceae bacterium]|nr:hypothetical protein [Pyrinomonadaceae bacterium]
MASNTHGNIARTQNSHSNSTDIHTSSASAYRVNLQQDFDTVLASLASMPENRRARQVSKWESIGWQALANFAK